MTLPYESLIGISFGILFGLAAALVVGVLGLMGRIVVDRRLPRTVGVSIAVLLGAVTGYSLGVFGPAATQAQISRLVIATPPVVGLALAANSQANRIADTLPRNTPFPPVSGRPLAAEAVDAVDTVGQVTIRSTGEVRELDGYPPLSPTRRMALEDDSWRLPADLPLSELETRLETRLRRAYDLAAVSVSIDARGRATIAAAPPSNGVGGQVPEGQRAVSITAILPTGLAPGETVTVGTEQISGTVLAVGETATDTERCRSETEPVVESASTDDGLVPIRRSDVPTAGGVGRLTLAVPAGDANTLLNESRARVIAHSSGTRHDFEACSLLDAAGCAIRIVDLDAETSESLTAADSSATVLAVRNQLAETDGPRAAWQFDPEPAAVEDSTEAFIVADMTACTQFETSQETADRREASQ